MSEKSQTKCMSNACQLFNKAYVTFMIFQFTGLPNIIACRIKSTQLKQLKIVHFRENILVVKHVKLSL